VRALTGAVELSYSGPTFADDLERQPLGSAVLVGGRLTLRSGGGTTLSLAVDNLADKVYLTSVDRAGPPASVTLRLSVPAGARIPRGTQPQCG
jgi:outer membrane receptor protein involved in Fe transport